MAPATILQPTCQLPPPSRNILSSSGGRKNPEIPEADSVRPIMAPR